MFRCDSSAAIASSCLRPSFSPCPAIRCHLVPSAVVHPTHRPSFAGRDFLHN
jgi:hypothetical protein